MPRVEELVKKMLKEGQSPESIISYLSTYGIKRENAEAAISKYSTSEKTGNSVLWVIIVLLLILSFVLGFAGGKLIGSASITFDNRAFYSAKIEHFSGTLLAFTDTSWTVKTDNGEITIVNKGEKSPLILVKSANESSKDLAVLGIGEQVKIYTLTEKGKELQVLSISAQR